MSVPVMMLYLSNIDRVLWPETAIAIEGSTPERISVRTAAPGAPGEARTASELRPAATS